MTEMENFKPGDRVTHTQRAKFMGKYGTVLSSELDDSRSWYSVHVRWDDGQEFKHHSFRLRHLNLIEQIGELG